MSQVRILYPLQLIMRTMTKRKFKVGDTITPKEDCQGFENILITAIDESFYHCKILLGKATIPIKAVEENYKLVKKEEE